MKRPRFCIRPPAKTLNVTSRAQHRCRARVMHSAIPTEEDDVGRRKPLPPCKLMFRKRLQLLAGVLLGALPVFAFMHWTGCRMTTAAAHSYAGRSAQNHQTCDARKRRALYPSQVADAVAAGPLPVRAHSRLLGLPFGLPRPQSACAAAPIWTCRRPSQRPAFVAHDSSLHSE